MDCLLELLKRSGSVVTRDELIQSVWHGQQVNDEAISRLVYQIRQSFKALDFHVEVIKTHRKRGYEFCLDYRIISTEGRKPLLHTDRRSKLARMLIVLLSLAVMIYLLLLLYSPKSASDKKLYQTVALTIDPKIELKKYPSIELLVEQLKSGINRQEGLIARLNIAANDTFTSQQTQDAPYRLNIELLSKASFTEEYKVVIYVKGKEYARQIYTITSDLSATAVQLRSIMLKLMQGGNAPMQSLRGCDWPDDIESVEQFFNAKRLVGQRGEVNLHRAIGILESVTQSHPNFARAWAKLANAYHLMTVYIASPGDSLDVARYKRWANSAASNALKYCPTAVEALIVNGPVPNEFQNNPLLKAGFNLTRALEIDPKNAEVVRAYAEHLWKVGRVSRAKLYLEEALSIDPWSARIRRDYADMMIQVGNFNKAQEEITIAESLGFTGGSRKGAIHGIQLMKLRAALGQQNWNKAKSIVSQMEIETDDKELFNFIVDIVRQKQQGAHLDATAEELLLNNFKKGISAPYIIHKLALLVGESEIAVEAWLKTDKAKAHGYTIWWPQAEHLRYHKKIQNWFIEQGFVEYWKLMATPDNCNLTENELRCL